MSFGKSSSKSQNQSTSSSELNPQALSAILGNYTSAKNLVAGSSYQALNPSSIATYESPFIQSAVDSTSKALINLNQQEQSQNGVSAAASGDYNSSRLGVQNALTSQLSDQTAATTIANLENTGFNTAETTAQTENTNANQFPLALQALLDSAVSPLTSAQQSNGQATGSSSASNAQASASGAKLFGFTL